MDIEVYLTGHTVSEEDVKGRTVVVIDVLRACSTITTALSHGARSVVPVEDMAEAGKIASNLDTASYLLGGERMGEKIEGYHLGNSPIEYDKETVTGRTIIMNTTNGTGAIARARTSENLIIGSFLNAERVVTFLREQALDVAFICAGWRRRVSLEDTLCAGLLLHRLWEGQEPADATDAAHIAFTQYLNDRADLAGAVHRSHHGRRLAEMGHAQDVAYCAQVDVLSVLPYYDDSQLVLYTPPPPPDPVEATSSDDPSDEHKTL